MSLRIFPWSTLGTLMFVKPGLHYISLPTPAVCQLVVLRTSSTSSSHVKQECLTWPVQDMNRRFPRAKGPRHSPWASESGPAAPQGACQPEISKNGTEKQNKHRSLYSIYIYIWVLLYIIYTIYHFFIIENYSISIWNTLRYQKISIRVPHFRPKVSQHQISAHLETLTGWWLGHPSEKY